MSQIGIRGSALPSAGILWGSRPVSRSRRNRKPSMNLSERGRPVRAPGLQIVGGSPDPALRVQGYTALIYSAKSLPGNFSREEIQRTEPTNHLSVAENPPPNLGGYRRQISVCALLPERCSWSGGSAEFIPQKCPPAVSGHAHNNVVESRHNCVCRNKRSKSTRADWQINVSAA